MDIQKVAKIAKKCCSTLAVAPTDKKNNAIRIMARILDRERNNIISTNQQDLDQAREKGIPEHLIDRLGFGQTKIDSRIRCLEKIAALEDPIGQPFKMHKTDTGLDIARIRVPLGVILMIYEARPHVTVNAGAFCIKSGNATILKGGSEARQCNELLGKFWAQALEQAGLNTRAIQVISGSHDEINELLHQHQSINLVIPRGGKKLIKTVTENSKIPVIKHYNGVCHLYIDRHADIQKAIDIMLDSKCLMPEVCNAMETLLIDEHLTSRLEQIVQAFQNAGIKVKGCEKTKQIVPDIEQATQQDWTTEYLDNIVSIRVVKGVGQAIEHINTYGSGHTDSIVTDSIENSNMFVQNVDSGVVLVNASTMFCDGESIGLGAEIGISTDKLQARGPMGLEELTSYKFVIRGRGHTMAQPEKFRKK